MSTRPGGRPQEGPALPTPGSQLCSLQDGDKSMSVLSYQVWDPLWLPEQRRAPPVVTYIPQVIKNVCSQTPGYGKQAVSC